MALRNVLIVTVAVLAVVLAGLYLSGAFNSPTEFYPPYGLQNASAAGNSFALKLYEEIAGKEPGNIFFSPESARTALAMAAEGAREETRIEMLSALGLPENDSQRRQYFKSLMSSLPETVEEANGIWLLSDYPYEQDFLNTVKEYYNSEAGPLDLNAINSWARQKTHGKIERILDSLPLLTRLVLTNAVYFKGTWEYQFISDNTRSEPFQTASGKTVTAEMMHLYPKSGQELLYYENNFLQALELPYSDGRLSMLIILPKNPSDISKLSENNFNECLNNLENTSLAEVAVPKFRLETKYELAPFLQAMGIKKAFNPAEADFSGITKAEQLYIDRVVQKAFVQVDEQGTEATAVTAITVVGICVGCGGGQPLPRFIADHPFAFAILDKQTGEILFMGRVSDPSK